MKSQALGHLHGALMNLAYSFNFIFLKIAIEQGAHPLFVVFCRVVGGTIFFAFFFWNRRKELWNITSLHWLLLILASALGASLNKLVFTEGLQLTSVIHASSIALLFPVFVIIAERVFMGTVKLKLYQYVGICLGLFGASLFVIFGNGEQRSSIWGDILVLLNFLFFSIYVIIVRYLVRFYSISLLLFVLFVIAVFIMVAFIIPKWDTLHIGDVTMLGMWNVLGSVIFASILAQWFNAQSLKYLDPSITAVYTYIQPLGGALLAVFLLGEKLTWVHVVAATFIGVGLYLTSFRDVFVRVKKKKLIVSFLV